MVKHLEWYIVVNNGSQNCKEYGVLQPAGCVQAIPICFYSVEPTDCGPGTHTVVG